MLLDEAVRTSPTALPTVQASRGVLLARTGQLQAARATVRRIRGRAVRRRQAQHESGARVALARPAAPQRGPVGAGAGRLRGRPAMGRVDRDGRGRRDRHPQPRAGPLGVRRPARRAARDERSPTTAVRRSRSGIRALDRARVLLAAGLLAEAREFADRAERIFAAERAKVDLADALLVQAEIDLVARQAGHRAGRRPAGGPHLRRRPLRPRRAGGQGDAGAGGIAASGRHCGRCRRQRARRDARRCRRAGRRTDRRRSAGGRQGRSAAARPRRCWRPATSTQRRRRPRRPPSSGPGRVGGRATGAADRHRTAHPGWWPPGSSWPAASESSGSGAHPARAGRSGRLSGQVRLPGPAVGVRDPRPRADPARAADRTADPFAGSDPAVAGAVQGGQHPAGRRAAVRWTGYWPGNSSKLRMASYRARMAMLAGAARPGHRGRGRRAAPAGPIPVVGGRWHRRGQPAAALAAVQRALAATPLNGQRGGAVPRQRPIPCTGDHRDHARDTSRWPATSGSRSSCSG